jgi:alpha-glucoside transport system permease protein
MESMAVAEDTGVVEEVPEPERVAPAPKGTGSERMRSWFSFGNVVRLVVFGALALFLLNYVGARDIAETALKVVLAVALTAVLWVGANLLFDQAFARWTLFNTVLGAVVAFVVYFVLEANRLLRTIVDEPVSIPGQGVFDDVTGWKTRPIDFNGLVWALIGGAALALVMFLLSAPRQRVARFPLAVVGFTGFGLLTAFAFNESAWTTIDWGKLLICVAAGVVLFGLIGLWRHGTAAAPLAMITGAGVGWLVGAWGGGEVGAGDRGDVLLATVVPAAILGARFGLTTEPDAQKRRRIERRSRSWIFVTPGVALIAGGLLIPLIRTIYLSFRNRNGTENVGWDNYNEIFTNKNSVNLENWDNMFTSRLFWIGLVLVGLGVLAGVIAGRRTSQPFERGPGSLVPAAIGFFILSCAILSSIRGTIFNNIWWVIVVVSLATSIGLAVAVLADRARAENAAKSLIFLPMAISFVGAGIIWRFVYQAREISQEQTGLLNAFWVWVGEVSTSTTARAVAVAVLAVIALGLIYLVKTGLDGNAPTTAAFSGGFLLIVAYLIYRLLGPGLGGFIETDDGTEAKPVLFIQEGPFNNMWLMVVLIWIQTGFAMVILSAAIKAVPTELTEAARVDGATPSQIFWRITLPQIAPTVGVVVTTMFITVMKVFDIVYTMTNGSFGTQVIANEMFERAFGFSDLGLGSALAVVLFVSVIPPMWINIRRMQKQAA